MNRHVRDCVIVRYLNVKWLYINDI